MSGELLFVTCQPPARSGISCGDRSSGRATARCAAPGPGTGFTSGLGRFGGVGFHMSGIGSLPLGAGSVVVRCSEWEWLGHRHLAVEMVVGLVVEAEPAQVVVEADGGDGFRVSLEVVDEVVFEGGVLACDVAEDLAREALNGCTNLSELAEDGFGEQDGEVGIFWHAVFWLSFHMIHMWA
jgi:hypothetical protein